MAEDFVPNAAGAVPLEAIRWGAVPLCSRIYVHERDDCHGDNVLKLPPVDKIEGLTSKTLLPQMPEILLILAELLPFEDAARLALGSVSVLRALEVASRVLASCLPGMEIFAWRPCTGALFQQLRQSMQAQILIDESCVTGKAVVGTHPMLLALETSGTFFVKFWVAVSNIRNGCPCMGVVDAAEVSKDPAKLLEDMSRPRKASQSLGISCNPFSGKIYASRTSNIPKPVLGQVEVTPRSWTAEVKGWESFEDELADVKHPAKYVTWFGVLISNGTLQFLRQVPNGWQSSGVVCDALPPRVLCSAFLFSFVGQAFVSVEEVCNEIPECIQRYKTGCGKISSWTRWPPWARYF